MPKSAPENAARRWNPSPDREHGASAAVEGRIFGPARVVATAADQLEIELEDGRSATARNALAWPYEPAVGDELLVAGDLPKLYVIGVLRGAGKTLLSFEGDVEVRAEGGELKLTGDRGVTVDGPRVDIRAGALQVVAEAATHIAGTLRQTVRDLWSLRAKEHHTVVEGHVLQHAKSTRLVAEDKVTVNGREIYLG